MHFLWDNLVAIQLLKKLFYRLLVLVEREKRGGEKTRGKKGGKPFNKYIGGGKFFLYFVIIKIFLCER